MNTYAGVTRYTRVFILFEDAEYIIAIISNIRSVVKNLTYHSSCVDDVRGEVNLSEPDCLVMCIFDCRIITIAFTNSNHESIRNVDRQIKDTTTPPPHSLI